MQSEFNIPEALVDKITQLIISTTQNALHQKHDQVLLKEWMSLNEAAKYADVSRNTFFKFRQMGLKVCEIDDIKRVSREEINRFLDSYSF